MSAGQPFDSCYGDQRLTSTAVGTPVLLSVDGSAGRPI
jgi:hypothetical protein